ncbi:L-lactate dehydrogenase [compost metagenome]
MPAIISANGVQEVVELNLNAEEQEKFARSCSLMRSFLESSHLVAPLDTPEIHPAQLGHAGNGSTASAEFGA